LALDIFLVVMWLASFALLASQVSALFSVVNHTYYDSYSGTYYNYASNDITTAWVSCLAAAAGLGGLEL
jgi:phosphoglucomutase